jgi:DNA invertase Pin-like site-specific DNA recombinase
MHQPIAYSYIRFSSKRQEAGDSIRRQTEGAQKWAEHNKVPLDTSLKVDKGVSAFKGLNADIGALGEFLALVEKGRVHPGDYLVVEALDRLTRDDVDEALLLLLGMTKAGVKIVQLTPVEVIYSKPVDPLKLMMMVMELMRGNSESVVKSERVSKAWANKRKQARNGKVVTRRLPAWVREVGGRLELIPERAEVIRLIFELARSGYGIGAITQKLNKDGVPSIGRGKEWGRPYVTVILHNRAVLGEYQPRKGRGKTSKPDGEPIPDYFPRVVTQEEFDAAQRGLAERTGKPGRPPKRGVNVFTGLVHDAMGGGLLYLIDKGKKGGKVLIPYKAHQGVPGTHRVSFPFRTFERAILRMLSEVNPDEVTGDGNGHLLTVLEGELKRVKKELAQASEFMDSHGFSPTIGKRVTALEERQAELDKKVAEASRRNTNRHVVWGEAKNLLAALDNAEDPDEVRLPLRSCLRNIIDSIWVVFTSRGADRLCVCQVWFAGGEKFRHYEILHRPAQGGALAPRPGRWWVNSVRYYTQGEVIDLRKAEYAKACLEDLVYFDPEKNADPGDYVTHVPRLKGPVAAGLYTEEVPAKE